MSVEHEAMPDHLTAEQIVSFKSGLLPYPQWLRALQHTQSCPFCKQVMFPPGEQSLFLENVRSKLDNVPGAQALFRHLDFAELWAYASGDYDGRDRLAI